VKYIRYAIVVFLGMAGLWAEEYSKEEKKDVKLDAAEEV
jgi:hypothetical protein